ncbi:MULTISPECIES: peptidylprolyl isomerase [unclassified Acinetobacter]|uniref:peptidylprolyl isomerase n=1 Tax=unclassified Acinetobacter TaxID=196816 RepID=UPI0035BB1241
MKITQLSKILRHTTLGIALLTASALVNAKVSDRVIAIVDERAILASELDQAVNIVANEMQKQGVRLDMRQVRRDVLNQLITRQAQLQQIERLGMKPTDAGLDAAVLAYAKQQGFDSLESFQRSLDSKQAGSYAQVRGQIAEDLLVTQLRQQQVLSRIKVSEHDIDVFLKSAQGQNALGMQVHTLHFRVAPTSQNTSTAAVEQAAQNLSKALQNSNDFLALSQQYSSNDVLVQGGDMGFKSLSDMPSELSARLAGLNDGQVSDPILAADGIHVVKVLARKSDDQRTIITEYATRHILIQPSESVTPVAAKQQIDAIHQRLKQGADFATLANTYSTDPGSRGNGGSLGWVTSGMMVPQFESVMKATPAGKISQPFQSQFGWHIIKVDEVRQSDKTKEVQRNVARQILAERQFAAEADNWTREIRANAYVDIKDASLK